MSEWQPIETAPEGCEFLAYDPVADKFDVCARIGFLSDRVFQTQVDGEYGPSDDEFDGSRATHWMPLPESPVPPQPKVSAEQKLALLEYVASGTSTVLAQNNGQEMTFHRPHHFGYLAIWGIIGAGLVRLARWVSGARKAGRGNDPRSRRDA